jgi:hypothetical protein
MIVDKGYTYVVFWALINRDHRGNRTMDIILVILIVVVPVVALVYFATYDYNDNNRGDA